MGQRGPAPKPTNLRVLHGDRKDRINTAEPQPADDEVKPPSWLSDEAKEVWAAHSGDRIAKGVLTAWDVEHFANLCDAIVRRSKAARKLDVEGEITEQPVFNKNGEETGHRVAKNPWWFIWNEADAQVQRYGAKFGFNASDRSGLEVDRGEESSDDLLSGSG